MSSIEYIKHPIALDKFDWMFYLKNSPDIKENKITGLVGCYQHWTTYGCYEGRKVRSIDDDVVHTFKLQPTQKFKTVIGNPVPIKPKQKIINVPIKSIPAYVPIKRHTQIQTHTKPIPHQSPHQPPHQSPHQPPSASMNSPAPALTPRLHKQASPFPSAFPYPFPSPSASPVVLHPQKPRPRSTGVAYLSKQLIKLDKPIALLIHIYDVAYLSFFIKNIIYLQTKYTPESIHIYINIVADSPLSPTSEKYKLIENNCSYIGKGSPCTILYNENRGGDIGGFLMMCKHINRDAYNHIIFVHSKTKTKWKYELCSTIFNYPLQRLTDKNGIIGCQKWSRTLDKSTNHKEFIRFAPHFKTLFEIYQIPESVSAWKFIAGTMFIANIKIINYIVDHDIDGMYQRLNRLESTDANWLRIVKEELKLDPRGCGNDLDYRVKYGKPLRPDYMIEHAYERIIGLICQHLNLSIGG